MINVLIISYNALPLDVVSSYRAKAYCDHLSSHGIFPTLLTHRWELQNGKYNTHDHTSPPVVEQHSTHRILRLPYPGKLKSSSTLRTVISYLRGNIDIDLEISYKIFKTFLDQHFREERYDLIVSIFNPHFHLKLAYESWKEFKIPYVLDFRDLWDNSIVTKTYKPSIKKKILDTIIAYWWKKWIKESLFFCTTGVKWKLFLEDLTHSEGLIIRNGFETELSVDANQTINSKKFKVIHFGRMYADQDVDPFVQGFRLFALDHGSDKVGVEIIGLKKIPGKDYQSVLRSALGSYVTFIPFLDRHDLIKYCQQEATLFFFPNFKEDNGQFSVKLYDYMALRKNIIVAPAGGEVEYVISQAKVGVILNTPQEVKEYLQKAYNSFNAVGGVSLDSKVSMINQYSRKNQVSILAERILSKLGKQYE